jgi:hypothetical protein
LEEVIERENNSRDGCWLYFRNKVKGNETSVLLLDTADLILNDNLTKKHTYRAKGGIVEESKKGYTGDALALRGDEGRDKLR